MAEKNRDGAVSLKIPERSGAGEAWDFVEPHCEFFGECGGCQLQHLSYGSQLQWKHEWLTECLGTHVSAEKILSPLSSPQEWHYRRRIQVHASPQGLPGFYGAGSARVVPITECKIADRAINESLGQVERSFQETLKQRQRPSRLALELTVHSAGQVEIRSTLEEDRYFLQSNRGANALLQRHLQKIIQALAPKRVLELFAGAGNFSLELFRPGMEWTAVEYDASAVAEGQALSRDQSKPIRWVQEKAHRYLKKLKRNRFDLIFLDPPRAGAGLCLKDLVATRVARLLYLSCAPAALAKDLKILIGGGYQVDWVQPFDFFPHTTHLESLVLLRQGGAGPN